jgi:hypothetical protein
MTISRSPGTVVGGAFVVGGGHSGATTELDDVVTRAARLLETAYGMDVTIRFNSDQASGGAWLVTDERDGIGANAAIGIGIGVTTQTHHDHGIRHRTEIPDWPEPAPVGAVTIYAHVGRRVVVDAPEQGYWHEPVGSLEEALAFVQAHGDLARLDEWRAERARLIAERAAAAETYAASIRGSRRQAFARACSDYILANDGRGEPWMPPGPAGLPYEGEVVRNIRRRVQAIWRGEEQQ